MEYRIIRPDEVPRFRQFQEYCFNQSPADYDTFMNHVFRAEHTRALFDENGDMAACMLLFPYKLFVDGARLGAGGLAGVASLPENRRSGYVGELLLRSLEEMKEQGVPLSILYPFKASFYRRYGWEVATGWVDHNFPPDMISRFRKAPGHIRRLQPDQVEWRELNQIYEPWASSRRGCMVRDSEWHWHSFVIGLHHKYEWKAALWHREPGAPAEGYMLFRFDRFEEKFTIIIRQLVALSRATEEGLWGFAANHDSQVQQVHIRALPARPFTHLLEHSTGVSTKYQYGWQLRLVDLKGAFEGRPWPEELTGSLLLGVVDEHAPWNSGTWRLQWEGGRAMVSPAPGAAPRVSGSVATWAQLYSGFISPAVALEQGRLECTDPAALRLLSRALAGEPMFFPEFF